MRLLLIYKYSNLQNPNIQYNYLRSLMNRIHEIVRAFILSVIDFFYPFFKKFMPLQTFRYAACGGGNTLLDFSLFVLVQDIILKGKPLHITDSFVPHAFNVAIACSFCITFPLGFYLSRYVVFQKVQASKKEQFFKYFIVVMFCFVLNYGFMNFFVKSLNWDEKFSKLITTVFVVMFSYLAQKHFTFKLDDGTELID